MTKTVGSLQSLNKKLPAGEGTLCRQKKLGRSPRNRPQLVRSPSRNASARWRRSAVKSRFLRISYPEPQNICHTDIGCIRTIERIPEFLFDITQVVGRGRIAWGLVLPPLPVLIAYRGTCNSLIHRLFSAPVPAPTLFPQEGLPTGAKSLFIWSNRIEPRVAVAR